MKILEWGYTTPATDKNQGTKEKVERNVNSRNSINGSYKRTRRDDPINYSSEKRLKTARNTYTRSDVISKYSNNNVSSYSKEQIDAACEREGFIRGHIREKEMKRSLAYSAALAMEYAKGNKIANINKWEESNNRKTLKQLIMGAKLLYCSTMDLCFI